MNEVLETTPETSETEMERYAFIDVTNTNSTVKTIHDFSIDWKKLLSWLKGEKWGCKEVLYYQGRRGNEKAERRHEKLGLVGYIVRSKITFIHQGQDKAIEHICDCGKKNIISIKTPPHGKSNCDVELTVDALERAGPDTEFLFLTGDGDFTYLIENLIEKGTTITIVSSNARDKDGRYHFSTRLKELLAKEEERAHQLGQPTRVRFIEINNWRKAIENAGISS